MTSSLYSQEIRQYRDLARAVRENPQGEWSEEQMVLANLALVPLLARRYQNLGMEIEDLIGWGNLGLLHAVRNFDATRGFTFSSYAFRVIGSYMMRALSGRLTALGFSINSAEKLMSLYKQRDTHLFATGELVALSRVAGLAVADLDAMLSASRDMKSLDTPLSENEEGDTLADLLEDEQCVCPDMLYERQEERETVQRLLRYLSVQERTVILLRVEDTSVTRVAQVVGCSEERVKTLERRALMKLASYARRLGLHAEEARHDH